MKPRLLRRAKCWLFGHQWRVRRGLWWEIQCDKCRATEKVIF